MPAHRTAIHWFRRDLRLSDNTALCHAAQDAETVIPFYAVSQWSGDHPWTGPGRQQFLCACLESLAKDLGAIGSRLIVRDGPAVAELLGLIRETKAEAVYFNRDPDPAGRETERQLRERCREIGVAVHDFKDAVLHEPNEALTGTGTPYRVYTPYSRSWFTLPKTEPLKRPTSLGSLSASIASDPIPNLSHWKLSLPENLSLPASGECAAGERLRSALSGSLRQYAEKRNIPAEDATSRLGPDLRYGTISVREIWRQAQRALDECRVAAERGSIQTFLKQLAWREFFIAILGHFPEVLQVEFSPQWRGLPWDDPDKDGALERWREGRTGFPIVDAGMRQLLATGYMHNRVRMITAMFLTKDLHLDWRLGEAHFMRHLIDGEIANNNGGWQWSAGTGADAAPYFRIQNPWTQTKRYDPEGTYIRRWVPELAGSRPELFCQAPAHGRPIADDYPLPMVDHGVERERTLDIFARHRER